MVAILDINITLQQITASPSNEQPFAIFFIFLFFIFFFFTLTPLHIDAPQVF